MIGMRQLLLAPAAVRQAPPDGACNPLMPWTRSRLVWQLVFTSLQWHMWPARMRALMWARGPILWIGVIRWLFHAVVTGNLPQLNDPTMIIVRTKVMVMLLLQYGQQWYALDQLEA
jgi:hypothetical protein